MFWVYLPVTSVYLNQQLLSQEAPLPSGMEDSTFVSPSINLEKKNHHISKAVAKCFSMNIIYIVSILTKNFSYYAVFTLPLIPSVHQENRVLPT